MKFLFINPPFLTFTGIEESGGHAMPLGLLYSAAYLRKKMDCEIELLDAEAEGLKYDGIEERLNQSNPGVVCFTAPTPVMNHVIEIASIAKKLNPDVIVMAGSMHPTAFPKETAALPNIDFAIVGEGEETIVELSKKIARKENDFENVMGIAFKDKRGEVIVTPQRPLIQNLDELPFPAWDLVDLKRYHSAPTKKVSSSDVTMNIMTSRGCAYDCIFCPSKLIWRRKVRYRSAKNVADEIEEVVKRFGIKEFNFVDDLFLLQEKRVQEVCEEIISRKLGISWIAFAKANTVKNTELLKLMKKAGCQKLSMGFESGDQEILDNVRKQHTLEDMRRAVKLVKQAGIEAHASFQLGNIGETEETMKKTIEFSTSVDLDNATFFITSPYPGTDLYYVAKEKGFITPKTKWEEFAPLHDEPPILVQGNVSPQKLVEYQKKAFKAFYLRPKYIVRKLLKIRSMSDLRTIQEGLTIFLGIMRKKSVGKKLK